MDWLGIVGSIASILGLAGPQIEALWLWFRVQTSRTRHRALSKKRHQSKYIAYSTEFRLNLGFVFFAKKAEHREERTDETKIEEPKRYEEQQNLLLEDSKNQVVFASKRKEPEKAIKLAASMRLK